MPSQSDQRNAEQIVVDLLHEHTSLCANADTCDARKIIGPLLDERDALMAAADELLAAVLRATALAERYGEAIVSISDALSSHLVPDDVHRVFRARVIIAGLDMGGDVMPDRSASHDAITAVARCRGCIGPYPCGRGAGANDTDLPCDCEHIANGDVAGPLHWSHFVITPLSWLLDRIGQHNACDDLDAWAGRHGWWHR